MPLGDGLGREREGARSDRGTLDDPPPQPTEHVYVVIRQTDGFWRTEIVPVLDGAIGGSGGGAGDLLRRSDVRPGHPMPGGEFHTAADDDLYLVTVEGVSADDGVRLRSGGAVVAEAAVAAHGHFVLSALLPWDATTRVEAF